MFSESQKGLLYGIYLAVSDVFNLGILKGVRSGLIKNAAWIIVPTFVYAFQPLVFFQGIAHTSMTALNLTWDVLSDVLVTATGIFFFKEKLGLKQQLGILFALIAVFLLSSGDE
jgi:multidrug transporter EmrE-like cation transporter